MIHSYNLKPFSYRTPKPYVDSNGEVKVAYLEEEPVSIDKLALLVREVNDQYELVIPANNYLLYLVIERFHKCVSSQSRALLRYFSFLEDIGVEWDDMPSRQSKRPTYLFKRHLESQYKNGHEDKLAVSTSKSYMRSVVNFYKFYISRGYQFKNPPFNYETITHYINAGYSSMGSKAKVIIQTTDLRLGISQQRKDTPQQLVALSDDEWKEVDRVIRKERMVVRYKDGIANKYPLPIEFTLIFLLMRYCGLRRVEVLSMKLSLIRKPTQEELQKGYLRLTIGGKDGVETKNSKERIIEFTSLLMKNLYEYTISERYLNRKKLSNAGNISLFINNKGDTFNNDTLNSRWSEVRNAIRLDYPSFNHKAHNLRPTYGVSRLKQLVNSGMQQADALSYIQNRMGHSSLATTLHYLHQLNNPKSGDELSEIAFDYLLDLGD